jgi:hypothetical protein
VHVGFSDPVEIPPLPPDETQPSYFGEGGWNPNQPKFYLDGLSIDESFAKELLAGGSAVVAPAQQTITIIRNGKPHLARWQAYADGYQGYVPVGARYLGNGQIGSGGAGVFKGAGGVTLRASSGKGGDTDLARLNGATDDEAVLGRSSSFGFAFGFQAQRQQGGGNKGNSSETCGITVVARPVYYPDKITAGIIHTSGADAAMVSIEIPIPRSIAVNNTPGFHTFIVVKNSNGNQVRTYTAGPNGEGRTRDELFVWRDNGEPDPNSDNGKGMNDARTVMSPFWLKGNCDSVIKSFDETMNSINGSSYPYVLTGGLLWTPYFDSAKSNTCNTFTWTALENLCPTIRGDIEKNLFDQLNTVKGQVPGWGHRPFK